MANESNIRPLVGKFHVRTGASGVVAGSIGKLNIGSEPPRTPLDLFATVPPLPPAFINRPELSEPLLERVLLGSAAVAVTAIEGMGGVGKTIVALGLCHEPRIREAFRDGIVWLSIGRESETQPEKRIEEIATALNKEFRVYTEATYRSLLKDKAVLVVLDDVWTTESVEPFLPGPGRSRLLYTSRDKSLAGPLNADEQEVGILDDAQARGFLAKWSGYEGVALPDPYATEILAECKGLVLGLAMIGAALKGQPKSEWADTLADLRNARLKAIDRRPGGYAYQTLHASIAVGVDALDPEARSRYLSLAILLEDMSAPEALLWALWGGEEREVRRTVRLFVDRCLARRDANGSIRLHDFQLDYICGEQSDQAALALEHSALLLSLHIISSDPKQFASQITGKLLAHQDQPGIASFLGVLKKSAPRPWLRPLWPSLVAAGGPALRALDAGESWVRAAALSADGRRAVSGSEDRLVRVYDLEGNQPPRILEGHSDQVRAVAISANGRFVASGSLDKTVRVWDLDGTQPPRILRGHTEPVRAVALSDSGQRVISGSSDRNLRVWDLAGSQPTRILEGHTNDVSAVALTADGQHAVSASHDKTLRVWDLAGDQPPRVLRGHTLKVNSVALSANGKRAVSASDDRTILVWDLSGDRPPRHLEGHTGPVTAVALSADGQCAVSGSRDKSLRAWDIAGVQPHRVLEGHTGFVNTVALSGDGLRAVSGSLDLTLRVWDLKGRQQARLLEGHSSSVWAVALSRDGMLAVSGSDDMTLRVWDLEDGEPLFILEGHKGRVRAVALSGNGRRAISGSDDGALWVWDLGADQLQHRLLEGHPGAIRGVALSGDGKRLVSFSDRRPLWIWDLEGVQSPRPLEGYTGSVWAAALSSDGRWLVCGLSDRTLRVWDLKSDLPPRILKGHRREVRAVTLSGDGRRAVSGSHDCSVWVWDLEEGCPVRILKGHTGPVHAVALSDDGTQIVSCSADRTLRVWSLATGNCMAAFRCDAEVLCAAWAGGKIIAGDSSGQVHLFVWEE